MCFRLYSKCKHEMVYQTIDKKGNFKYPQKQVDRILYTFYCL